MKQIQIFFKCACMQDEGSFHLVSRNKGEAVEDFMSRVQDALSKEHHSRSPLCISDTVEYIKIPFESGTALGDVTAGLD